MFCLATNHSSLITSHYPFGLTCPIIARYTLKTAMLELPHAVVGATIATKIPNPFIAIPAAFLSHFLLDVIPHWNPHLYTEKKKFGRPTAKSTRIVVIDVVLSLAAGFFIAYLALPNLAQAVTIIVASFAAVAIDVVEGFYFFFNINGGLEKLIKFQRRIQWNVGPLPGLIIQAFVILFAFWIALS